MTEAAGFRDVGGRRVRISNPQKVLFPADGITKLELIDHYERCAALLLASVGGRPFTLRRYPDGIDGEGWFQKHAPSHLPEWVSRAAMPKGDKPGVVEHIVVDSVATLLYLANLAAIELHSGPAPAATPDHPAELVLDFDPPPGAEARVVRRATRRCQNLLDELGIPSRLKTSGSAGFHVHVALRGPVTQDLAREVARGLATVLAGRHPAEMTVEHRIERRGDRVFVDWLRNSPRQTFVAPYSIRAREGAPVATPMDWDELSGTDPRRWKLRTLQRRLDRQDDPWAGEAPRIDPHDVAPALATALHELGPDRR